MVENNRAKIQTAMQLLVNQLHIMVVDKEQKRAVVIAVVILVDGNTRKKKHKKRINWPKGQLE